MNGGTIEAPTIEYALLAPMLLIFGAAVVGVLVEAFAPRYLRKSIHVPLTLLALAGGFLLTILQAVREGVPTTRRPWAPSRWTAPPCSSGASSSCWPSSARC
nr:hypothetical protein GCM10020093_082500 [Planobispora longispora]